MAAKRKQKPGISAWWELCRPRQALSKNSVVFAALLFSGRFVEVGQVGRAFAAFASFLCLSSAIYALNDLLDVEQDRQHPEKKHRPIASGKLDKVGAGALSAALAAGGMALAVVLGWKVAAVAGAYLLLQGAYSLWLKHQVILDVFLIAAGFVLRAVAGAVAIAVYISPWLLLCASLLALFLGLAKRRHELTLLAGKASKHRRILEEYSAALLDQLLAVVAASTILAYALYSVDSHLWHGFPVMMATVPFVLYGIMRYLYLIHQRGLGGSPELVLFRDPWIRGTVLAWVAASALILVLVKA